MSAKNFAFIVLACLVKDAFYADAAPSITRDDLTVASKTVDADNRVLKNEDNEHEVDVPNKSAFENFIQGLHNIDTAMEAMIDNYTDGVEHLSEEHALHEIDDNRFDKMGHERKDKSETEDQRNVNPTADQIEKPLINGGEDGAHSISTTEGDMVSKGGLSGLVPGGGGGETNSAPASNTPAAGSGGSSLPFGGLPTGIPGAGGLPSSYLQGDNGGQSPKLIIGGFSALVMPMNTANMASMLSAGQQLGQLVPKPGVG